MGCRLSVESLNGGSSVSGCWDGEMALSVKCI